MRPTSLRFSNKAPRPLHADTFNGKVKESCCKRGEFLVGQDDEHHVPNCFVGNNGFKDG